MHLSTKGRFAVTAMIDLALNSNGDPVTLSGISKRQGISISYLEQLFSRLRRNGLVQAVRGPGGGYLLNKYLATIKVSDIIFAVDEPMDTTECGSKGECRSAQANHLQYCMTHELWTNLNRHMIAYLDSVNLASLVEQQKQNRIQATQSQKISIVSEKRSKPNDLKKSFRGKTVNA